MFYVFDIKNNANLILDIKLHDFLYFLVLKYSEVLNYATYFFILYHALKSHIISKNLNVASYIC